MNAELQQLKDIHLPQAVTRWPIAPGWIALVIIATALLGYLLYAIYKRNQKKYTVKFALAKLKQLRKLMSENPDNINIAAEISTLIRRTALYYFRREEIAGLSGADWLNFLDMSGNTREFTRETGRLLTDAPYQKSHPADLTPLFVLTHAWLVTLSRKKRNGYHV